MDWPHAGVCGITHGQLYRLWDNSARHFASFWDSTVHPGPSTAHCNQINVGIFVWLALIMRAHVLILRLEILRLAWSFLNTSLRTCFRCVTPSPTNIQHITRASPVQIPRLTPAEVLHFHVFLTPVLIQIQIFEPPLLLRTRERGGRCKGLGFRDGVHQVQRNTHLVSAAGESRT